MCLPPELSPGDSGAVEEQYFDDVVPSFPDITSTARRQSHNALSISSILGKHALENGFIPHGFGSLPKAPRFQSPTLPSSDSAAASLMARLEQSMLDGLQPQHPQIQQHQQQLLPSTFPSLNSETSLQHLQHALLLQQVQQTPSAAEQHQMLLLAQQRLLQQSRSLLPGTHTAPANTLLAGGTNFGSLLTTPRNACPTSAAATSRSLLAGNFSLGQDTAGLAQALANHGTLLGSVTPFEMGQGVGDGEKKCKRMESNRASAKRSRQRKQARMEELDKATASLQEENSILCQKLGAAQSQIQGLKQKNVALEEEVGLLRKMLAAEEDHKPGAASSRMSNSSAGDNSTSPSGSAEELEKCGSQDLSPLPYCEGADGVLMEGSSDGEDCSLLLKNASLDDGLAGDVFSELLACLES